MTTSSNSSGNPSTTPSTSTSSSRCQNLDTETETGPLVVESAQEEEEEEAVPGPEPETTTTVATSSHEEQSSPEGDTGTLPQHEAPVAAMPMPVQSVMPMQSATNHHQGQQDPQQQASVSVSGSQQQAQDSFPTFLVQKPQSEPSLGNYQRTAASQQATAASNISSNPNPMPLPLPFPCATATNASESASASTQQPPLPLEENYVLSLPRCFQEYSGYQAMTDSTREHNSDVKAKDKDTTSTVPSSETQTQPRPWTSKTVLIDHSSSRSTSQSQRSQAAKWFALETTPEDRLSLHIIITEIKTVLSELFHFLRKRNWKKKLLTVLVIVISSTVFFDLFFGGNIRQWIRAFLIWMTKHPMLAEFAFVGVFVLATQLFIPPTLLLLGAGWAFADACGMLVGILAATISCFMGSVIGSLLSYVRARYMMRDLIELFVQRYPIIRATDQALKRDGFRIMLLLRLCPLIPFHGLNYLGGISSVSWETFVKSLVGVLPYQVMVIVMGASAGTLHNYEGEEEETAEQEVPDGTNDTQQLGMIILTSAGVAFFLIAMVLAFRFTKKELQKELNLGENEMESYITTIRRMSLIDLYDDDDDDDDDDEEESQVEIEIQNDNVYHPHPNSPVRPCDDSHGTVKNTKEEKAGINRYNLFKPTLLAA